MREREDGIIPETLFLQHSRNENANGLIRQYLPKGESMAGLSQHQCNAIADRLNTRPRKRLGFRTPLECFNES